MREGCTNCAHCKEWGGGFWELPEWECLKEDEISEDEFYNVFQDAREWKTGEKPLCHCYEMYIEEEE